MTSRARPWTPRSISRTRSKPISGEILGNLGNEDLTSPICQPYIRSRRLIYAEPGLKSLQIRTYVYARREICNHQGARSRLLPHCRHVREGGKAFQPGRRLRPCVNRRYSTAQNPGTRPKPQISPEHPAPIALDAGNGPLPSGGHSNLWQGNAGSPHLRCWESIAAEALIVFDIQEIAVSIGGLVDSLALIRVTESRSHWKLL